MGAARITVEFELDVDLEAAANDVRDRVSRSLRKTYRWTLTRRSWP
jgi:multidrug efflux pump